MAKTTKNEVNEANDGWTEITAASANTQPTETTTTEPAPVPKRRKTKTEAPVVESPATEPTPAPKKRKSKAAAPATEPEVAPALAPVEPTPAPKKGKRTKSSATLADVFKGYVESLEAEGKSEGTIASYRMELALAADDLGLDTPIADIKPERVLIFMTSDRVMKKRNGKSKSPLSIDKTRRVLRQALTYAETAKLVAVAPVPELAVSH